MIAVDARTLAEWTAGRVVGDAHAGCHGLSTDSRTLAAGNAFVCLRGPNFDGHEFAAKAVERGAAILVTEQALDLAAPQVIVSDARAALGTIASHWRARFDIPVIAVTGSNGKTTVKECIAAILRQQGATLATEGNLNNDIGVPLMLCRLAPEHTAAVFELGANHAGEIATLARWVRPAVGVLNNAGPAHLEGFGSIAGVARAKGELLEALGPEACAVFPADSEWTGLWRELAAGRRQLTFGEAGDDAALVQVREAGAGAIELTLEGERCECSLALPGAHNRRNAAAAAAAAHAVGIRPDAIAVGLGSVGPVAGRLVERTGVAGSRILDDSYNANPGSFAAALTTLADADGRRWAVVGEMAELGEATREAHERLGRDARAAGVERLWAFGPTAARTCAGFGAGAREVGDVDALAAELRVELTGEVVLLIKGSRSNALERLVGQLLATEEG